MIYNHTYTAYYTHRIVLKELEDPKYNPTGAALLDNCAEYNVVDPDDSGVSSKVVVK